MQSTLCIRVIGILRDIQAPRSPTAPLESPSPSRRSSSRSYHSVRGRNITCWLLCLVAAVVASVRGSLRLAHVVSCILSAAAIATRRRPCVSKALLWRVARALLIVVAARAGAARGHGWRSTVLWEGISLRGWRTISLARTTRSRREIELLGGRTILAPLRESQYWSRRTLR